MYEAIILFNVFVILMVFTELTVLKKQNHKLKEENSVLKYNLFVNGFESPRGFWE